MIPVSKKHMFQRRCQQFRVNWIMTWRFYKGDEQESRHQVFKSTGCPKLLFIALTAHSASPQFHATIFMCEVFVRLKALERNMQCQHVNESVTGNVISLIFCTRLWSSSCQLQISPLYPADERQSNKVYNCGVKH